MQKVLRRTALAKAQAVRKATRRAEKNESIRISIQRQQNATVLKQVSQDIRNARKARREDWDLGPLAPKRDVGEGRETYGTMDQRRIRGLPKPREERTRFWNIVPGDRVVLLEGRDKGKIGEVKRLDGKTEEVVVEGLNMVDVAIPKFMLKDDEADKRPVRSIEKAVSLSWVRLVHAMTDPETGVTRDVIVKKLVNGNVWFDRHAGTQRWQRYIAGLNVPVPWPKKEPKKQAEHDIDTPRLEVESRTWVPTLLRPPMPPSVIDELRNKYSKFRDRHDDDYIRAKMLEDEKEGARATSESMSTPLREAKRRERQEKKSKGKPKLTTDMLARIGEIMARNQERNVPPDAHQGNATAE